MLASKGRLELPEPAAAWRAALLATGVEEITLDGEIAVQAVALESFHPDPGDRFVVATALAREAALITSDRRILAWPGPLERLDARR